MTDHLRLLPPLDEKGRCTTCRRKPDAEGNCRCKEDDR